MTVREANLTPASSADREPEMIESGGTARLHLTLATTDYDHFRDFLGTIDVLIVLPVSAIKKRYFEHFDLSRRVA